jgi:GMP synthase (glutamine-hydrolysing)
VSRHAVVQIDTEHPSSFGVGPARWSRRLRRRLETASGQPVEVVHYLDARDLSDARAIVLSGSSAPWAAHDSGALERLGEVVAASGRPVLGICAGMQLLGRFAGGRIEHAAEPEIGELELEVVERDGLLRDAGERPRVFQYHTDELTELPAGFRLLARTDRCRVQAIASDERGWWGTQFHPESYRSANPAGARILRTFFELADGR